MRMGPLVCAAIAGIATLAAGAACARPAAAAERDRGARWYVDVVGVPGAGCVTERVMFEREVALACAAVGTCHVVGDTREAELRATLVCLGRDAPWTLELHTVEGTLVSTTELTGAPSDRLREAAIEIARDQAPERTLAAASLRDTLTDGDRAPLNRWKPPTLSLAVGAAGGMGATGALAESDRVTGGGRATLGLTVAKSTNLTLGTTALLGGSASNAARHWRTGVGVAFGAPFDASFFGVALEGGLDVSQSYITDAGYRVGTVQTRAGVYGQAGLVLAWPLRTVRPYVAAATGVISAPRSSVYATGDIGLVFPLF